MITLVRPYHERIHSDLMDMELMPSKDFVAVTMLSGNENTRWVFNIKLKSWVLIEGYKANA